MGRIKDLVQYVGSLSRGDIWFMLDGNTFARGMKMSGQQVYDLCKGENGKQILIQNNGTHIQWQYQGDAGWTNLVLLSTLKGVDGKELEIRSFGGYVQTRLVGGTWANLIAISELKGEKGDAAANPNLQFEIMALAANATPTASVSGTYPNLTVHLGIPRGENAVAPVFGFQVTALAWDATPTASVSGTYPNLTVTLGLPRGKDAAAPAFTFDAEGVPSGTPATVETSGTYPNLKLTFKIPAGAQGNEGRGPVVLANGNYGNWDSGLNQFVDSGVPAVAAVSEAAVTFTQAEVRANIATGESLKVLMGKIRKWFFDLKSLAFKDKVDYLNDIDNVPTGLYDKPTTGIPKLDLDPSVQSSLSKADSALQSFVETDPVYTAEKHFLSLKSELNAHNVSGTAHDDIRTELAVTRTIAEGKERAVVFDTLADLDAWLGGAIIPGVDALLEDLQTGDNFYIRDTDVPDFWWDGTQRIEMEGKKVDLTDYLTKSESDNRYQQKEAGKGLSKHDLTDDRLKVIDFVGSESKSSLANMAITEQIVIASAGTAQTLSIASVALHNAAFEIWFTATAAITVAVPNTGSYESMAEPSYSLANGERMIISGYYSTVSGKYHLMAYKK